MRFVEYTDYGDAPVVFVSGTADVSLVDDTVEVVLFVRVKQDDGTFENRVCARLRQSLRKYIEGCATTMEALEHITTEAGERRVSMPVLVAARH
jgi:hypothetical protein